MRSTFPDAYHDLKQKQDDQFKYNKICIISKLELIFMILQNSILLADFITIIIVIIITTAIIIYYHYGILQSFADFEHL